MAFRFADFDDLTAAPPTPPADVDKAIRWLDTNWSGIESFDEEPAIVLQAQNSCLLAGLVPSMCDNSELPTSARQKPQSDEAISTKRDSTERPATGQATPPTSSPSREEDLSNPQQPPAKKIRFSPFTSEISTLLIQPHTFLTTLNSSRARVSGKRSMATKSILKNCVPLPSSKDSELKFSSGPVCPADPTSFTDLLESVIKELQGESRSSRLDAYLALSGYLKECTDIPEPQGVLERIGFFEYCLQRDTKTRSAATEMLDGDLISQALKLTIHFLRTPSILNRLSRNFIIDLTEDSIAMLECPTISKKIFQCYLRILALTPLLKTGMTSSRCNKIIDGLADLESRHVGHQISSFRLSVYHGLLVNATPCMLARVDDWMGILLRELLSPVTEIRSSAINTSIKAGVKIGSTDRGASAAQQCLEQELEGRTIIRTLELYMERLLDQREHGHHVPRIWTALILLVRSKKHSFQELPQFMDWMKIIQRCFNSSDQSVNLAAYMAWDRLTYIIKPDQNTSLSIIRRMSQPIVIGLAPPRHGKNAGVVTNAAFASYCNFLYYAFRPQASTEQLDLYWTEFVERIFTQRTIADKILANRACRVLNALFTSVPGAPWQKHRVIEGKYPVRPEDLPRLPAFWVRRRLDVIIRTVELLLRHVKWMATDNSRFEAEKLWIPLMKAISEASAKEIKASKDLKAATAACINLFFSLRRDYPSSLARHDDPSGIFHSKFAFLISGFAECLGPLNLSSKMLVRKPDGFFEASIGVTVTGEPRFELASPIEAIMPLLSVFQSSYILKLDDQLTKLFGLSFVALSWLQTGTKRPNNDALPLSTLKDRISQKDIQREDWRTLIDWAVFLGCKFDDDTSATQTPILSGVTNSMSTSFSKVTSPLQARSRPNDLGADSSTHDQSSDDDFPSLCTLINRQGNNSINKEADEVVFSQLDEPGNGSDKENKSSNNNHGSMSSSLPPEGDSKHFLEVVPQPEKSNDFESGCTSRPVADKETELDLKEDDSAQSSCDSFFDCPSSLDVHSDRISKDKCRVSDYGTHSKLPAMAIAEDANGQTPKSVTISKPAALPVNTESAALGLLGVEVSSQIENSFADSETMVSRDLRRTRRTSSRLQMRKEIWETKAKSSTSPPRDEDRKTQIDTNVRDDSSRLSESSSSQDKRRKTRSSYQSAINDAASEIPLGLNVMSEDDPQEGNVEQPALDETHFDGECIIVASGPCSPISDTKTRTVNEHVKPTGHPGRGTKRNRDIGNGPTPAEFLAYEDGEPSKRRRSERLTRPAYSIFQERPESKISVRVPSRSEVPRQSRANLREAPRISSPALRTPSREKDLALMASAVHSDDQESQMPSTGGSISIPEDGTDIDTDVGDDAPDSPSPSQQAGCAHNQDEFRDSHSIANNPQTSMASNIIGKLKSVLADCRQLVLGIGEQEEGEILQDLAVEVQVEILQALRNRRKRVG